MHIYIFCWFGNVFLYLSFPHRIPVLPMIVPFAFDKGPARSGQDISITCTVSDGDLPLDIEWVLNDKPVSTYASINSAKFGKRNMVLSIESVSAEHSGNYTCEASNKAGRASFSTDLKVYGTSNVLRLIVLVFSNSVISCPTLYFSFVPRYNPHIKTLSLFSYAQNSAIRLRKRTCQYRPRHHGHVRSA